MDKRRDPATAGPKERRTSGDILHDHVGGYNRGHTATFFEFVCRICGGNNHERLSCPLRRAQQRIETVTPIETAVHSDALKQTDSCGWDLFFSKI